jgi:16S rRNA (cytosine967-C5)-methyltransferase
LASRWLARLGAQRAVARARTLLEQPPTHLRLNPRFSDAEARLAETGVRVAPAYLPGALELVEGRLQPLLDAGVAYAQDAGSQLVARLAASEGRVLDACAAPGGKSLLVADLGAGRTRVVAQEASQRRVRTLRRICSRWGTAAVSVVAGDALRPPFAAPFDAVLLDAPCSGLGTLARHPDIRWRSQPGDLQRHAARQRALLESVSTLVRRGGRLVYATCSIEPEENEAVVAPFLAAHPEFASEPLPEWCVPFADGPFVRVEPQPGRGDSFFAAALRRVGEAPL